MSALAEFVCEGCAWPVAHCQCQWIDIGKEFLSAKRPAGSQLELVFKSEQEESHAA